MRLKFQDVAYLLHRGINRATVIADDAENSLSSHRANDLRTRSKTIMVAITNRNFSECQDECMRRRTKIRGPAMKLTQTVVRASLMTLHSPSLGKETLPSQTCIMIRHLDMKRMTSDPSKYSKIMSTQALTIFCKDHGARHPQSQPQKFPAHPFVICRFSALNVSFVHCLKSAETNLNL